MQPEEDGSGQLSLHLLDGASGRVVQTWKFEKSNRITIGRGGQNDIQLADQQVSRLHLELVFEDDGWRLMSHGRNGTRIDGEEKSDIILQPQTVFQLGPSGPSFRFDTGDSSTVFAATIAGFGDTGVEHLFIDEQKKTEEVNQIVEGDAFRALQEQAQRLRENRPS